MAIAPVEMPPTKQPCPAGSTEPVAPTSEGRGDRLLARSHDSRATRLRPFLLLRYTLVAATAYLIIVEDHFAFPSAGVGLLIAAALASNVLVSLLPERIIGSKYFGASLVIGDTAWITAALLASGRFQADFVFLYFFVILLAAMGESLWLIVVGSVVVCIAYVYVLSATGSSWTIWSSPSIIRIPFLFTAAAFYGHMVDAVCSAQKSNVFPRASRALSREATGEKLPLRGDATQFVTQERWRPRVAKDCHRR